MVWLLGIGARIIFWTVTALMALCAILIATSQYYLPLVDQYRPQIERNIAQITGLETHVGLLNAELDGLNLVLVAEDVTLSTIDHSPVISLESGSVSLNLPRSLFTLTPHFSSVRLMSPVIGLVEQKGRVFLPGFSGQQNSESDPTIAITRVLNYIADQRDVRIDDLVVRLNSERFGTQTMTVPQTRAAQQTDGSYLSADVYVNDQLAPISIRGHSAKTNSLLPGNQISLYVKLPEQQLPFSTLLSSKDTVLSGFESVRVGGEFWLHFAGDGRASATADLSQLVLNTPEGVEFSLPSGVSARYNAGDVRVVLNDVAWARNGQPLPKTNLILRWLQQDKKLDLGFDQLNAEFANELALKFLKPEWRVYELLSDLSPKGMAANASLSVDLSDSPSYQYRSNLINASVEGSNGIPKASGVNGVFSLNDQGGAIEFEAENGALGFPTVYADVWQTQSMSGFVEWRKQQDAFVVSGKNLHIKRNEADVVGGFRLEVVEDGHDWLDLNLRGVNIPMTDRLDYIPPRALSAGLTTWLTDAVDQGSVSKTDVLVHTNLTSGSTQVRIDLDADANFLKFDPNWPPAHDVKAKFIYDRDGVLVTVEKGYLEGLDASGLAVSVPISHGTANWLMLTGSVTESAPTLLTSLRKTPLKDLVLKPFEQWTLLGEVSGDYAVAIPLSSDTGASTKVNLAVDFSDNALYMEELALAAQVQDGKLIYQSAEGLSGSWFNVEALGGKSRVELTSNLVDERFVVNVGLNGTANAANIALWRNLGDGVASHLGGKVAYSAEIGIDKRQAGQIDVKVNADLTETHVTLPPPLAKEIGKSSKALIDVKVFGSEVLLESHIDDHIHARSLFIDGEAKSVSLGVGQNISATDGVFPEGVSLVGQADKSDLNGWLDLVNSMSSASDADTDMALSPPSWLRLVDVLIDEFEINENNILHNAKLNYHRGGGEPLVLSSDELNAQISEKEGLPFIHIGYLNWQTAKSSETSNEPEDKTSPIAVERLPSAFIAIDQLYIDDQPYGDWQAKVTKQKDSVVIAPITTKLNSGKFEGSVFWQGGDTPNIEFVAKVSGKDAKELTQKFSPVPFISSKAYNLDIALSWQSHVFDFDRPSLDGRIVFKVTDGNFNQIDQLPPFLRVLGIFNINALTKRLTFNFKDLYEPGMPFDEFTALLNIERGQLTTTEPIMVKSTTAEVSLFGNADLVKEQLDERLTATVPISSSLPVAGLLLATPQVAGLLFITDKLIGDQISKVTSIQYQIEGPFENPSVEAVKYKPLSK